MNKPPKVVGGAQLVQWSFVDERHRPTGNCRQVISGAEQGPAAGLAICRFEDKEAFYLFGCDADWNPVSDTWHETLEKALDQAEFEYEGISDTWNVV
jgi:hypothetical protein